MSNVAPIKIDITNGKLPIKEKDWFSRNLLIQQRKEEIN
jgi:hypothetical protein